MRAFIAIPMPDEAKTVLSRLSAELDVGRAVAQENLHLTLAFLDDQTPEVLAALHEELTELEIAGFDLRVRSVDTFGGKWPRLVFAGIEPSEALSGLRGRVRSAVRAAGIHLPRDRFRPHVTLARIARTAPQHELRKVGAFLAMHGAVTMAPFPVRAFALYRSELTPEGPRYEVLAEYALT